MRLFVAVDPGESVLAEVEREIERLRPLAQDAKWVRAKGSHLTLVFLGEVPEETLEPIKQALLRGAATSAPFAIEWRGGGCFGGKKPRVLWVGVKGNTEALASLQRAIANEMRALGLGEEKSSHAHAHGEERAYQPHLTLARAREARGDARLWACAEKLEEKCLGKTEVAEVILYQSELSPRGSLYTPLFRVALAPASID